MPTPSLPQHSWQPETLRADLITHILTMKNGTDKTPPQPEYARYALRWYHEKMPWLDLIAGVKEAMKSPNATSC